MGEKIRVGVFGAGRGRTMIGVLEHHPDAELVAVCDKYQPLLDEVRKTADEAGCKVALYDNFEDFFKHDMDAVVLANYATEHAPYAIRLLDSGRHVLSEVLPCQTMSEAVRLIEAVERSGKVYAYAENYCYMTRSFEMWRRYEAGDIGEMMYGEGEYVHDCAGCWPQITYGEPDHWRNHVYAAFYCTHSFGPLMTVSGRRPVRVVGMETQPNVQYGPSGCLNGGCGVVELITMDNGAVVKSLHGNLKREPSSANYEVYGTRGMMETERFGDKLTVYRETVKSKGEREDYVPQPLIAPEQAAKFGGHAGSDYYATHFFLEKILGRPEGLKYSIDVYRAVDMGIVGILGYRSILNGSSAIEVPDLRDKTQRDAWRGDNACCDPAVAGDQLWPSYHNGNLTVEPAEYERVRSLWLAGKADQ